MKKINALDVFCWLCNNGYSEESATAVIWEMDDKLEMKVVGHRKET